MVDETLIFDAEIDRKNKQLKLFQKIEVVENNDKRLSGLEVDAYNNLINKENFITIKEACEIDPDLEIGDFMEYELEFENIGRNAATILNSNFEYKLQRYLEQTLMGKYQDKIGKSSMEAATRIDRSENTFVEIGEVKGMLPRKPN